MSDWNPQAYLAFADERARPVFDLLNRVPRGERGHIVDLGCGPASSTLLLRRAYPDADFLGVDSSPAMIMAARRAMPNATFIEAEARGFDVGQADLVFANALYQWMPDHVEEMARISGSLKPGAVLAVQMPDNLDEPSHALMRKVASQFGVKAEAPRAVIGAPQDYHAALKGSVVTWRTNYHHLVADHGKISDFYGSTGLKPYLDAAEDAAAFRAAYVEELQAAYPALPDGRVLFAVPRFFVVVVA